MKNFILALLLFSIINFTIDAQNINKSEDFIITGEYASMIPLKRIDTLRISLISNDTLVAGMLSNYIDIEKDHTKANLLIFTNTNDFEYYRSGNKIAPLQQSLLIENDSVIPTINPDIIIIKKHEDCLTDAIQFIFGGARGKNSDGDFRLGFGVAEEVGLDYNKMKCQIDSIAKAALDMGVSPGLQVLVARHGLVVFHETYGYHDYDSIKEVKKDDIYDWASITKITSALPALMKLHDEDKFDLDANLGTYIPYFNHGNKKDLIFRRILSHNAGLQAWIPFWKTTLKRNGKFKRKTLSNGQSEQYSTQIVPGLFLHEEYKEKIYKQIRRSEVNDNFHPGYIYSGLTFYILPEIVEKISSENYQEYLSDNFYNPLGAGTVGYLPLNRFDNDRIIPTEIDSFFRHSLIDGTVHDEGAAMMEGVSANAGLFGSTLDLAKIMQMYLWKGEYGGEQYISENTINKFTFAHYANEGNKRGLGFDKPNLENREDDSCSPDASMSSFGHGGYTGTYTWADPETGILFVFMSNRVYPTRENRLLYELAVRPSMHQAVYDAIID